MISLKEIIDSFPIDPQVLQSYFLSFYWPSLNSSCYVSTSNFFQVAGLPELDARGSKCHRRLWRVQSRPQLRFDTLAVLSWVVLYVLAAEFQVLDACMSCENSTTLYNASANIMYVKTAYINYRYILSLETLSFVGWTVAGCNVGPEGKIQSNSCYDRNERCISAWYSNSAEFHSILALYHCCTQYCHSLFVQPSVCFHAAELWCHFHKTHDALNSAFHDSRCFYFASGLINITEEAWSQVRFEFQTVIWPWSLGFLNTQK